MTVTYPMEAVRTVETMQAALLVLEERMAFIESDVARAMTLQRFDRLDQLCVITTAVGVPPAVASLMVPPPVTEFLPGEFVRYAIRTPVVTPFGLEEPVTNWFFVRYLGRFDRHAVVENANGERFLVQPELLATADVQLIEPPVRP